MALFLFLFSLASAQPSKPVTYRCLDNSRFTLTASPTVAIVRFSDAEYRLSRRPSSLTVKYESNVATLFLDGDFAAFIADDRPLPGCYRIKPRERG